MGELAVGDKNTRIKTGGIGSCVAITLYDDQNHVGGMAHAMLPKGTSSSIETKAKYVGDSIDNLITEIEKIGGKKENLKAKIVGGSKMFKLLSGDNFGIGYQNTQEAKEHLKALGIFLESEDVGGTIGRSAELNLENGLLQVYSSM